MCAIFGLLDYKNNLEPAQRLHIIKALGTAAEIRGTDATGIAFFQRDRLCIQKAPKPAHKMKFRIPSEAQYITGHTRMTTQGSADNNQNNHPFPGKAGKQNFALAHNGILHNDWELRRQHNLPRTPIQTDSYVAVQLIEKQNKLSFDSLKNMAEVLEGSFTFTILDQDNNLYFVKGSNPLTIFHYPKLGLYLYASTEEILLTALKAVGMEKRKYEVIQPWSGEILKIDSQGHQETAKFEMPDMFPSFHSRLDWLDPIPWRSNYTTRHVTQEEYINAMKTVAIFHGFDADEIDAMLADGYTTEDIEDMIYCGR